MFAWMKMRSWIALVMPIVLTGLHALSVETPTTVSIGSAMLLDGADDVLGASMLVRTASYGKYSQVGTCLSAAAFTTMSASRRAAATLWKSRTSPMRNSSSRSKLW